ncbi:MAG: hypothetical protein SFW64_03970 [Alphaproteobacteria bacterium]|nr:hypothetical protein [Alphaproteobacteria bacterium]
MTISLNGASVDTGPLAPTAPAPRALASLLATVGAADPAALARNQLPSAVAASTALATLPPQLPPALKPLARAPSSQLAAQFIAQDASLSAEDLAIFMVRQARAEAAPPAVDDYLASLRIARGELPTAGRPTSAPIPATASTPPPPPGDAPLRASMASLAAGIAPPVPSLLRRTSLAGAKGADAYRLAQDRSPRARPAVLETR